MDTQLGSHDFESFWMDIIFSLVTIRGLLLGTGIENQNPLIICEGVLRHYNAYENSSATEIDGDLYNALIEHLKGVSELPEEAYYWMVAAWVIHTYLQEHFQYSPVLIFKAVPERWKTRTGKVITRLSYGGIHVESLREAYIFRLAENFAATIFIDVMNLWKKAFIMTQVYAHLSDKHLYHVVSLLPSPNMVTFLVTPDDFVAPEIPQVIDNKMVGDTGFEPVTSTVCKRHKKKGK